MALVAYSDESDDYSDNEETPITNSNTVENKNLVVNTSIQDSSKANKRNGNVHQITEDAQSELLSSNIDDNEVELNDNDVVDDVPTLQTWHIKNNKSTEQVFKKKEPKTKKVKLVLPALSEFDEDEEEEIKDETLKRKVQQPSSSGTGLFSVLPKPRSVTSLVPQTVVRKKAPVPQKKIKRKQSKPVAILNASNDSDEEADLTESTNFFSLGDSPSPPSLHPVPDTEVNINPPVNDSPHYIPTTLPESAIESPSFPTVEQETLYSVSNNVPTASTHPTGIDTEALRRLAGRRNAGEIPDVIDINADDALMPRNEWVTRALCDEKPKRSFSKKREGNPTQQQKRKHQITFLAHQAQEREQELQNSWGQNRFTKMQTQSKYGF